MKSPFPGMDPYLEKYWHEVHQRLVIYAGDTLQGLLPPHLKARIQERVVVEQESDPDRSVYPDVYVVEHPPLPEAAQDAAPAAMLQERPLRITVLNETFTEGYIDIVDADSGNRVVTTIEFLSPTNKLPGYDRKQYRRKQRELKRAGTNLVEIDLTRTGRWTLAIPRNKVPRSHRTTYRICVWRAADRLSYDVYRVPLSRPLPSIDIPLRPNDAEVRLDLQPLVDRCYSIGRYDLDYRTDPDPPLEPEDAKLADEWLRGKGLR